MKRINIQNIDGSMEEVNLVNSFVVKDINKNFVILSKGEVIKEGMSKVYISEVVTEMPGTYKLVGVIDESVWDKVKQSMKEIVQGLEGNYVEIPDNAVFKNEGNRVIGLKDEDLKKIEESYKPATLASVEPVEPVMPEATVVSEPAPVVETATPAINQSVEAQAEEAKNIFDQMVEETPVVANTSVEVPEVAIPGMEANVFDNPAAPVMESAAKPVVEPVSPVLPVVEPTVTENVNPEVTLSTPQDLYQTVAEPVVSNIAPAFEMPTVETATVVETPAVESAPVQETAPVSPVMPEEEPAVVASEETPEHEVKPYEVYLESVRKAFEDKDAMIEALKQKNEVLARENERLNNELKIANERMTIAEGARQEAFSQATPEANRVLTPETNINMAA